jgi:hypothetical protein
MSSAFVLKLLFHYYRLTNVYQDALHALISFARPSFEEMRQGE